MMKWHLKDELQRLLVAGVLYPKGTFSYLSPHPTVYRVAQESVISANGCHFYIHPNDDVTFLPWVARVARPSLCAPLYIGHLQCVTTPQLCPESFPAICHWRRSDRAVLHHLLPKGHC